MRPHQFITDRDVVLAAVKRFGWVLDTMSAELRAGREVVLAAVRNEGYALRYAANDLRADREVVLEAVFEVTVETLRNVRDMRLEVARLHLLAYADSELRGPAASSLATLGSHCPLFSLTQVAIADDGLVGVEVETMSGAIWTGDLNIDATLDSLARRLVKWHGHWKHVLLLFPGCDPVTP